MEQKYKVLFLDDDKKRVNVFEEVFHCVEVFWADDIDKAVWFIQNQDFDMIWIDYDLGLSLQTKMSNNGFAFALYLKQKYKHSGHNTIIHTVSSIGSQQIKSLLPKSLVVPFYLIEERNEHKIKNIIDHFSLDKDCVKMYNENNTMKRSLYNGTIQRDIEYTE